MNASDDNTVLLLCQNFFLEKMAQTCKCELTCPYWSHSSTSSPWNQHILTVKLKTSLSINFTGPPLTLNTHIMIQSHNDTMI